MCTCIDLCIDVCVCVCVCVHIHIRIHIDKGANTAQKVFSYNRRCSHTTEEPARAADAAEDDTAEVRQRRQGAPAGPRPKGPGEEADLNICICMRVSRPRGTGSVGDSVGEGRHLCVRMHTHTVHAIQYSCTYIRFTCASWP